MLAYAKFQIQRRLRSWRRKVRSTRISSSAYLQQHVWGKWHQLGLIRRFVVVWWGVLILSTAGLWSQIGELESYYLTPGAISGGYFVEGAVGQVKLINPILPENSLSADISRLVFNGLVKIGPNRQVEPDLATSWSASSDGKTYTFNLRRDVRWHDGVPFTSRDVLFTLTAIQNPDTRSPLASSWLGIKADAKDDYTVILTLPNPYGPFIYSTTVGIIPSHSLETSEPSALRVAAFNQRPIGTGPYKIKSFAAAAGEVELEANPHYYAGKPKIDRFNFRLFDNYNQLVDAYAKRQVSSINRWNSEASNRQNLANVNLFQMGLPDQTNLFFRTTAPNLTDKTVRKALALAIDRSEIIQQSVGDAVPLTQPILPGQLGYMAPAKPAIRDLSQADKLLTSAGWLKSPDGARQKGGQVLQIKLLTSTANNYPKVAEVIAKQWSEIGVKLQIVTTELPDLQQTYIRPRNYDILLYGINIGADPDVYAYWHSSQIDDPGINLSQYSSSAADKALESGRISTDHDVRTGKYRSFLQAWNEDTPAIVLYRPNYYYAVHGDVKGITARLLVQPSDRFYGVENWTSRTKLVPKGRH